MSKEVKKMKKKKAQNKKETFPSKFPFWARLKISKNRTTLVIDEDIAYNKKKKKYEDGFVHREATHSYKKDYEEVKPNPDRKDSKPMYLKKPAKHPKVLFSLHNKSLLMPKSLIDRYSKNNNKK